MTVLDGESEWRLVLKATRQADVASVLEQHARRLHMPLERSLVKRRAAGSVVIRSAGIDVDQLGLEQEAHHGRRTALRREVESRPSARVHVQLAHMPLHMNMVCRGCCPHATVQRHLKQKLAR